MNQTRTDRFYIPALDGLRFIAFLLVFIHHAPVKSMPLLSWLHKAGWIGVDIFFCLSAFLLTRLLCIEYEQGNKIQIWNFFMRRILRVWPLYFSYVILLPLMYLLVSLHPEDFFLREAGLLTFTDNLMAAVKGFNSIGATGHLWTISYEEQFYLVLPFLTLFLVRRSKRSRLNVLTTLTIVGLLCRMLFIIWRVKDPAIWVLPITHFESIFVGVLFGLTNIAPSSGKIPVGWLLGLVAMIGIILLPDGSITSWHLMILYPLVGAGAGGIVCAVLSNELSFVNKILSARIVAFLGKISFGLYVFHVACIYLVYYLAGWNSDHWVIVTILSLLLTIVVSAGSYYILERPFLRLKKKYTIIPSRPV